MTNTQLVLSIGVPSVLVILAWLSNNSRLSTLEGRFSILERRIDGVVDANHRDALELMRAITALHERVAVVESRQAS